MSPRTDGFSLNGTTPSPAPILFVTVPWTPDVETQVLGLGLQGLVPAETAVAPSTSAVQDEPPQSPPLFLIGQQPEQRRSKPRRKLRSGRVGRISPTGSCSIVGQSVAFRSGDFSNTSDQTTDSEADVGFTRPSAEPKSAKPEEPIVPHSEVPSSNRVDPLAPEPVAVPQPPEYVEVTAAQPPEYVETVGLHVAAQKPSAVQTVGTSFTQLCKDVRNVIAQPPLWGLLPPANVVKNQEGQEMLAVSDAEPSLPEETRNSQPSDYFDVRSSRLFQCSEAKKSHSSEYFDLKSSHDNKSPEKSQSLECSKAKKSQPSECVEVPSAPFIWMIPSFTPASPSVATANLQPFKECLPLDAPPSYESTFPNSVRADVGLNCASSSFTFKPDSSVAANSEGSFNVPQPSFNFTKRCDASWDNKPTFNFPISSEGLLEKKPTFNFSNKSEVLIDKQQTFNGSNKSKESIDNRPTFNFPVRTESLLENQTTLNFSNRSEVLSNKEQTSNGPRRSDESVDNRPTFNFPVKSERFMENKPTFNIPNTSQVSFDSRATFNFPNRFETLVENNSTFSFPIRTENLLESKPTSKCQNRSKILFDSSPKFNFPKRSEASFENNPTFNFPVRSESLLENTSAFSFGHKSEKSFDCKPAFDFFNRSEISFQSKPQTSQVHSNEDACRTNTNGNYPHSTGLLFGNYRANHPAKSTSSSANASNYNTDFLLQPTVSNLNSVVEPNFNFPHTIPTFGAYAAAWKTHCTDTLQRNSVSGFSFNPNIVTSNTMNPFGCTPAGNLPRINEGLSGSSFTSSLQGNQNHTTGFSFKPNVFTNKSNVTFPMFQGIVTNQNTIGSVFNSSHPSLNVRGLYETKSISSNRASSRFSFKPPKYTLSSARKISFGDKLSYNVSTAASGTPRTNKPAASRYATSLCSSVGKNNVPTPDVSAAPGATTTTVNTKNLLTLNTSMFVVPAKTTKAGFSLSTSPSGRKAMYRTGQPRGSRKPETAVRSLPETAGESKTEADVTSTTAPFVVRIENLSSAMQQLSLTPDASSQPCVRINTDNLMIQITSDSVKVVINPTSPQLQIKPLSDITFVRQ